MNWSRIAHWVAVHLVIIMAACVGTGIFWAFDTNSPIGEIAQHIEGEAGIPQYGQFNLQRTICVTKAFSAVSQRAFIDGVVYNVPMTEPGHFMAFPEGCSRQVEVVDIPHTLPPGSYRYQIVLQIQLNPLTSISVRLPVVHLRIIPDAGIVTQR